MIPQYVILFFVIKKWKSKDLSMTLDVVVIKYDSVKTYAIFSSTSNGGQTFSIVLFTLNIFYCRTFSIMALS